LNAIDNYVREHPQLTCFVITAVGMAAMGFVDAAMINLRERDDHWNKAASSFCAGAIVGLVSTFRSFLFLLVEMRISIS
jgi:hypothetical protein